MMPPWFLAIIFLQIVESFNLAVDVTPRATGRLLGNLLPFFEQKLEGHEIPTIQKQRCLGRIALGHTQCSQVKIEDLHAELINGDYYLKLRHVTARLHGDYNHNVLFVHQKGDFDLRVRDLNATMGPLVPIAVAGLPFITSNVGCSISHKEDQFDVHGGILRVVARKRLRETLETDLENILCDSLITFLDEAIRQALGRLRLKTSINDDAVMSFYLSRPPLLLPSGAIRFFHDGVSSTERSNQFRFDVVELNTTDHDLILHVHQNLVTEALTAFCEQLETEIGGKKVRCQSFSADFETLEKTESVTLTMRLEVDEEKQTRIYNARLLHSERLTMFLRLKSEILKEKTTGDGFSDGFFSYLAEELKSRFELALPVPKGMHLEKFNVLFGTDRLVLAANLTN